MQSRVLLSAGVVELVLVSHACTCPGFFLVPSFQAQVPSCSTHTPFRPTEGRGGFPSCLGNLQLVHNKGVVQLLSTQQRCSVPGINLGKDS